MCTGIIRSSRPFFSLVVMEWAKERAGQRVCCLRPVKLRIHRLTVLDALMDCSGVDILVADVRAVVVEGVD